MHPHVLRAWWAGRQGLLTLDPTLSPAAVLGRHGWARSVGGAGPYLTMFSRAGVTREQADRALAALEIHELPAARGCTYVVPRADFALALKVCQGFGDAAELATAKRHLGVTDAEIDKLCAGVLSALDAGPQDPAALKSSLGGLVRNLGPEGKRRGLTTTLPLALGRLQAHGEIRRQPLGGRLDQQRYSYARWRDAPLRGFTLSEAEAHTELARRYFRWIGPATNAQFAGFSGLGVKAAKAALAPLGLVPIEPDSPLLILPDDLDALRSFVPPETPAFRLISSLDGLVLHRRELAPHLDPADLARLQARDQQIAGSLQDLACHAIVDRGRVVGLWEYDPDTRTIAWSSFIKPTPALRAEVERTEAMIRAELGDVRAFSLDSPESRRPRIEALRAQAA